MRAATRPCHDEVDRLYGGFDLHDARAYAAFLCAHARALFPLEAWIDLATFPMRLPPRAAALAGDLAALGMRRPRTATLGWAHGEARRWGAAYVVEGSRLGGSVLSRAVAPGLPRDYLSAGHAPGAWRAFLAALDARAERGGPDWRAEAIAAAKDSFALFADAARDTGMSGAA